MVYEPAEDTFLLAAVVEKYARGKTLDVGTGSGHLALVAKKKGMRVSAVDIDSEAVVVAKKNGIAAKKSDLFSNVTGTFDTIIFNPPYLPQDKGVSDAALYGGKRGYETVVRFLENASAHLNAQGQILLLFSSLTRKNIVDDAIEAYGFEKKEVAAQKLFMEELFVYRIVKSNFLNEAEAKKITRVRKFAKGQRGEVWEGKIGRKKVAIKVARASTFRIENEIRWLRKLNKKSIGPKLLLTGTDWFAMEFVDGELIEDVLTKRVKREVLRQCRILDQMNVDKAEMNHPFKHVIVGKKVVMIDFERCKTTQKPKNVTQFCQYIGIRDDAVREYKTNYDDKSFKKILALV